jgi:hypothetical protein
VAFKDYNVSTRFTVSGQEAVAAAYKSIGDAAAGLSSSSVTAGQGVQQLGQDAKASAGGMASMDTAAQSLWGSLTALAGVVGISLGFGELIKTGIEFNQLLETTRLGIAGGILGTRQWTDENGAFVTGQKAVDMALQESAGIQNELREDAKLTVATFGELSTAFQRTLPLAAKAGIGSLDDMRDIVVQATQAMAGMGIPTANAAHELRGLFTGQEGLHFQFNQMLGITKAQIDAVLKSGGDTAQLFKDRIAPYAALAAEGMKTLTGRLSNLKDIIDETAGGATEGLFSSLKQGIADVTKWLNESEQAWGTFGTFLSTIATVATTGMATVFGVFFSWMNSGVQEMGMTWARIWLWMAERTNNIGSLISLGVTDMVTAIMYPWDALRLAFAGFISGALGLVASLEEALASVTPGKLGDSMKAGAESIRDAAADALLFGAANNIAAGEATKAQERVQAAYRKTAEAIDAAKSRLDNIYSNPSENPSMPKPPTVSPKIGDEIEKVLQQWNTFADKVMTGLSTAGLTGLDKALADTQKKYDDVGISIDAMVAKVLASLKKIGAPDPGIAAAAAQLKVLTEAARGAALALDID